MPKIIRSLDCRPPLTYFLYSVAISPRSLFLHVHTANRAGPCLREDGQARVRCWGQTLSRRSWVVTDSVPQKATSDLETWASRSAGPLFEGNPVGEGTTRRGTATPVHRPQRPAPIAQTRGLRLRRSSLEGPLGDQQAAPSPLGPPHRLPAQLCPRPLLCWGERPRS